MSILHASAGCFRKPRSRRPATSILRNSQFHNMDWQSATSIVAINAGISLPLALVINNLPGRHFTLRVLPEQVTPPVPFLALEHGDIEWALRQMDSEIDLNAEDLQDIHGLALQCAQTRVDGKRP